MGGGGGGEWGRSLQEKGAGGGCSFGEGGALVAKLGGGEGWMDDRCKN